jgi:histidinol-phosphate aminotransferase
MRNLALQRIQDMKPYSPPLDGRSTYKGMLLDFNERTDPSLSAIRALEQLAIDKKLNRYPEYFDVEKDIAEYAAVDPAQVMIVNGTDQGIDVIFRTFTDTGDTVIIPTPTFAMYEQYAQVIGNRIVSPSYQSGSLEFALPEVLGAINEAVKLIVVTNPNSPTGTLVSLQAIETIAQKAKNAIVYVDEAYFEFSQVTAVALIKEYPNIIVSRTFSKAFGLAALRIGYVIANAQYITEMLKVRGPYDVNAVASSTARAVLEDREDMERYVGEVMNMAKPFVEQLFTQNNVTFWPSAGNFILFRPDNPDKVLKILLQNGVLVRPQNKPNIEGTLRLTIGTLSQMKAFADTYLKTILQKTKPKYAFLDRDGTLILEPQDTYQIDSLEKLQILDGVLEGLKALVAKGYTLALVSNQDGLGTASFPTKDFEIPQETMLQIFGEAGVTFDQIFICPHLPEDNCTCRKPKTGLLQEFLRGNQIDLEQSFVCGDRASDKGLAKNLGLRFVSMQTNGNFLQAITPVVSSGSELRL